MQGAVVVIGIGNALEVWDRRSAEDVLHALRLPARARREEGLGDFAAIKDHLASRRFGGGVRRRGLAGEAAVDLTAGVAVEVEAVAADSRAERERARLDRLGTELGLRPRGRRLVGDDSLYVLLERERVDDVERTDVARGRHDLERAAVDAEPGDRHVA